MSEKEKPTIARALQLLIPVAGVSVAVASLLLSTAARKKELTCVLLNSTRLVSENLGGISPDMRVEFRGQPIYSLSKMTFALRNTGAAAVRSQDVSEPVRLQFPAGTRLLSAAAERTLPTKFSFLARAVPETGQVQLDFPLLNSGDEAVFSVYLLNSDPERPALEGRVVDVPQLIYTDSGATSATRSSWPHWSHATRTVVRWILIVLYSLLSLAAAGVWVYETVTKIRHGIWAPKWEKAYRELREELSKRESEELRKKWEQVYAEAGKLSPADRKAYTEAHAPRWDFHAGRRRLDEELRARGIPPEPDAITSALSDYVSFSLTFLAVALLFAITVIVVRTALAT